MTLEALGVAKMVTASTHYLQVSVIMSLVAECFGRQAIICFQLSLSLQVLFELVAGSLACRIWKNIHSTVLGKLQLYAITSKHFIIRPKRIRLPFVVC